MWIRKIYLVFVAVSTVKDTGKLSKAFDKKIPVKYRDAWTKVKPPLIYVHEQFHLHLPVCPSNYSDQNHLLCKTFSFNMV